MTKKEFDQRVEYQAGCDRTLGDWKIIDIHQIPEPVEEWHELDFYCNKGDKVVLLRIRNRDTKKYDVVQSNNIDYWIAELPATRIDDSLIRNILERFDNFE